jgi:hypothetical protein
MKKILFTIALAVGLVSASNAQTPTAPAAGSQVLTGPMIAVDKEVHDFGNLPYGSNATCEFKVTNTGTEPLILTKCKGSCGCTVPTCDPNPIAPGASSNVIVKFDTKRPGGPINKSITITSNAVNEPNKIVRIKGTLENDPNAPLPGSAPVKSPTGPTN